MLRAMSFDDTIALEEPTPAQTSPTATVPQTQEKVELSIGELPLWLEKSLCNPSLSPSEVFANSKTIKPWAAELGEQPIWPGGCLLSSLTPYPFYAGSTTLVPPLEVTNHVTIAEKAVDETKGWHESGCVIENWSGWD